MMNKYSNIAGMFRVVEGSSLSIGQLKQMHRRGAKGGFLPLEKAHFRAVSCGN